MNYFLVPLFVCGMSSLIICTLVSTRTSLKKEHDFRAILKLILPPYTCRSDPMKHQYSLSPVACDIAGGNYTGWYCWAIFNVSWRWVKLDRGCCRWYIGRRFAADACRWRHGWRQVRMQSQQQPRLNGDHPWPTSAWLVFVLPSMFIVILVTMDCSITS